MNERGHMPTSVPTVTRTDRARRTTSYWAFCPKCSLWGGGIWLEEPHHMTWAKLQRRLGKKTCLAFLALCPMMGNSPIIGKNFTNNGKSTPDRAMAIIACDKVDEWEGKEGGMIEDIWRTVCWSGKRRLWVSVHTCLSAPTHQVHWNLEEVGTRQCVRMCVSVCVLVDAACILKNDWYCLPCAVSSVNSDVQGWVIDAEILSIMLQANHSSLLWPWSSHLTSQFPPQLTERLALCSLSL